MTGVLHFFVRLTCPFENVLLFNYYLDACLHMLWNNTTQFFFETVTNLVFTAPTTLPAKTPAIKGIKILNANLLIGG